MELKPIDRTDRARARLDAALQIYRETILPEAQNPERQILYWIDHGKDDLSDEFRCFAIQQNGRVIGYLQFSYFREEHVFFFEYLCIRDPSAHGLVPSTAMKKIEDYLAQTYRPGFSIVFEVAHVRSPQGVWLSDTKLVKYFTRFGFRTISFCYRYPVLQSYDGETSYPADLMVMMPDNRKTLSASEMRTILRCLYFKHYLRWDRPFLDTARFSERERLINALYTLEIQGIANDETFDTSGPKGRSEAKRFKNRTPKLAILAEQVFGPKLLRISVISGLLLGVQAFLGNTLLLFPFVLAVAAVFCLSENTEASRKLFIAIIARFRPIRPRP